MKQKVKLYTLLIFLSTMFLGCDRDLETEGISKITYYPEIEIKGELFYSVPVGGTWTDQGAIATEAGKEIAVTVGGDAVNLSVPGVYTITYSATNVDGFSTTVYRSVGVIAADAQAIDLSGKYKRNAGAEGVSTVEKVGPGLYYSDNIGGTADPSDGVFFYHYEGTKLGLPEQLVGGSVFYGTSASVKIGVSYSWAVMGPGYGTAIRTFVKQ